MNALQKSAYVIMAAILAVSLARSAMAQELREDDIVLESLPEDVVATMEARDQWFASLPASDEGLRFFVADLQRWEPGQTVRVAFLGGNSALHKQVADATKSITDHANLKLDFGFNASNGTYRSWSTSDTTYAAEIRVSFDQSGNFSLVGRDSINANIGMPNGAVGGRPSQRSLNLGGFHIQLPAAWQRTVRHEFLHALAFHHEHQSPAGGCDAQFRWENDPGYQITQDADGRFINDSQNRRPGIYLYLSGYPNFWGRQKVDHNLRQHPASSGTTASTFDQASIMLYRFPALFYASASSPCAPSGGGDDLSAGDIAGLQHLYPSDSDAMQEIAEMTRDLTSGVRESDAAQGDVKAALLQSLEGIE
jgi:hypothetical protein